MSERIKQALLGLSSIFTMMGLFDIAEFVTILADNVEVIWTAVWSIVSIITALVTDYKRIFK